jgi:ribokinase
MAQRNIVVVGSSNTDMIIQLPRIPRPGETIIGGRFSMAAGGKGANQAVAAARAGGQVRFVARVGNDMFGRRALQGFEQDGIDVSRVLTDAQEPSGTALIFVEHSGENCIAVAPGANACLTREDVLKAAPALDSARILLMQLETSMESVAAAAELAAARGITVILNPAPAAPVPDELLSLVTIVTPNESEAQALTGIEIRGDDTLNAAADHLLAKGVQTVLVTLGARGAFVATANRRELIPTFKVQAVDTTAAGDVFNGALAVALSEGNELSAAVRFANAAAALSVTRLGAQPSIPARAAIDAFLNSAAPQA